MMLMFQARDERKHSWYSWPGSDWQSGHAEAEAFRSRQVGDFDHDDDGDHHDDENGGDEVMMVVVMGLGQVRLQLC